MARQIIKTGVGSGDRIAHLAILPIEIPDVEIVDYLPETKRGNRGYGSSGR